MTDETKQTNDQPRAESSAEKPKRKATAKPRADAKTKPSPDSKAETAAQPEGAARPERAPSKSKSKSKSLRITQVRSGAGRLTKHRATLAALGLKRHQHSVVQNDNPAIRGMLFQVRHLVEVEELEGKE
jgi:large subunit ribosomal protein L30